MCLLETLHPMYLPALPEQSQSCYALPAQCLSPREGPCHWVWAVGGLEEGPRKPGYALSEHGRQKGRAGGSRASALMAGAELSPLQVSGLQLMLVPRKAYTPAGENRGLSVWTRPAARPFPMATASWPLQRQGRCGCEMLPRLCGPAGALQVLLKDPSPDSLVLHGPHCPGPPDPEMTGSGLGSQVARTQPD